MFNKKIDENNAYQDLTTGKITTKLWRFALPLMLGNVMQQFYNLVDTWIVGKYIGPQALAAVGSSYTLMTFLTSVILGLCLGSSAFFSMTFGRKDFTKLRNGIFLSFTLIGILSVVLSALVFLNLENIIQLMQVPEKLTEMMATYLYWVFWGICATFFYNFFANLLRGIGNSVVPLIFLSVSVLLNIGLDLYFVINLDMGIKGAAVATTISQYLAGIGLMIYYYIAYPVFHLKKKDCIWNKDTMKNIAALSGFTCMQQSVMNLGILMVQGIVNGFGASVMSAFAVAVKIDTICYMPVQDFGNAFSTFVAQNFGAGKGERIKRGIKQAIASIAAFCIIISAFVCCFAEPLMKIFVSSDYRDIIDIGIVYLRVEGACYFGIGILFMLYGFYRGVNIPKMSLVLTVISLGTRVILAFFLSKVEWIGVVGIWIAVPIGWVLADIVGISYYLNRKNTVFLKDM